MTLLICPVRPGDSNEELRYAMRSWETNLILPNMRLLIVGHCPAWVKPDHFIEGNHFDSVALAVFDNVRLGAGEAAAMGEEEVIYMNDDFFCLDPVGAILPVKRNQTLAQHIAVFPENASSWWPKSLRLTASWLSEQGYPHPDSYEAHRPLLVRPRAMLMATYRWLDGSPGKIADLPPQWRTIYGVLNEVDAYPVQDCKIGTKNTGIGSAWISTSDQSWRRFATSIMKRFQKPSRWEIG